MTNLSQKELLEKIFNEPYEDLIRTGLRVTRVRIPGKEVSFAHVITPDSDVVYKNLGLNIGVHEGEDHTGRIHRTHKVHTMGTLVAADTAMKAADVEIGFMDRFCGSLIISKWSPHR